MDETVTVEVDSEEFASAIEHSLSPRLDVRPWEQWPNETDEWYARFLVYLSLGPNRTIISTYQALAQTEQRAQAAASGETEVTLYLPAKVSATWTRHASDFAWDERAAKYDVFTLSQLVPQTVTVIFRTITEFARVTMERLQSREILPETWSELQGAVVTLASYISPEIIEATVNHATDHAVVAGLDEPDDE